MPRILKSLEIKQISTTDLIEFDYVVPARTVTTPSLVITNVGASNNKISLYINDGSDDFLIATRSVPCGAQTWRVAEMSDQKLNAGFKIKIQASESSPINYFLSGSEITD